MATVTISSDSGAQKNKICYCFHCFPSICHEVMGLDAMILVFWMLNFKPAFLLSSFTFVKSLFSSSSISAVRVVSSAYMSLLIFLLAILIPACVSLNPAFRVGEPYSFISLCCELTYAESCEAFLLMWKLEDYFLHCIQKLSNLFRSSENSKINFLESITQLHHLSTNG